MLWYKAWLETRARFLISLFAISGLCAFIVYHQLGLGPGPAEFYYGVVHSGHEFLAGLWLGAVTFLVMGGLLREKATGASSLTLALPFSRAHLVAVRAAVGVMQAIVLIVVPSAAMWLQDAVAGRPWPTAQIWFHCVVLLSGGLVFLASAFLISSIVSGENTAALIGFCVLFGGSITMSDLPALSPFHFMAAADYFNRRTGLVSGPLPWLHAGAFVLVAAALLAASVKAIQVREF